MLNNGGDYKLAHMNIESNTEWPSGINTIDSKANLADGNISTLNLEKFVKQENK